MRNLEQADRAAAVLVDSLAQLYESCALPTMKKIEAAQPNTGGGIGIYENRMEIQLLVLPGAPEEARSCLTRNCAPRAAPPV